MFLVACARDEHFVVLGRGQARLAAPPPQREHDGRSRGDEHDDGQTPRDERDAARRRGSAGCARRTRARRRPGSRHRSPRGDAVVDVVADRAGLGRVALGHATRPCTPGTRAPCPAGGPGRGGVRRLRTDDEHDRAATTTIAPSASHGETRAPHQQRLPGAAPQASSRGWRRDTAANCSPATRPSGADHERLRLAGRAVRERGLALRVEPDVQPTSSRRRRSRGRRLRCRRARCRPSRSRARPCAGRRTSARAGASCWHGMHHEFQKFTTTVLPARSASESVVPSSVSSVKAGAGSFEPVNRPFGDVGIAPVDVQREHDTEARRRPRPPRARSSATPCLSCRGLDQLGRLRERRDHRLDIGCFGRREHRPSPRGQQRERRCRAP